MLSDRETTFLLAKVCLKTGNALPVWGNSMAPLLREGDVLEVDLQMRWLYLGDIVVFRSGGETVVHRIVEIWRGRETEEDEGGPFELVTKGDRLWWCDPPISSEQVLGRVRAVYSARGVIRFDTWLGAMLSYGVACLSKWQARVWEGLRTLKRIAVGNYQGLPVRLGRWLIRLLLALPLRTVLGIWSRSSCCYYHPPLPWRIDATPSFPSKVYWKQLQPHPRQMAAGRLATTFLTLAFFMGTLPIWGPPLNEFLGQYEQRMLQTLATAENPPKFPRPKTPPQTRREWLVVKSRQMHEERTYGEQTREGPQTRMNFALPSASTTTASRRADDQREITSLEYRLRITELGPFMRIEALLEVPEEELKDFAHRKARELKRKHGLKKVQVTGYRLGDKFEVRIQPGKG